jgi:hypothetical protein
MAQLDLALPLHRHLGERDDRGGEDRHEGHDDEHLDEREAAFGGARQSSCHLLSPAHRVPYFI